MEVPSEEIASVLKALLQNATEAELINPSSFFNIFNQMLDYWCGYPNPRTVEDIFIAFWKAADAQKFVSSPSCTYYGGPVSFDFDAMHRKFLLMAKKLLESEKTVGQGLLILFWYLKSVSDDLTLWNEIMGTSFLTLLLQYIPATSPPESQTQEQFKYHKKIAMRSILTLLESCQTSLDLDEAVRNSIGQTAYDQSYYNLATQMADPDYMGEIIEHWDIDFEDREFISGCQNAEVVKYVTSQCITALAKVVHGGGLFQIPHPQVTCLYEHYMRRLKKLDETLFQHTALEHSVKMLIYLIDVHADTIPITSAVVPLKQLAVAELLKSAAGILKVETTTPFLLVSVYLIDRLILIGFCN